jgi:cysteine desulfurase/selenocysteine lyase
MSKARKGFNFDCLLMVEYVEKVGIENIAYYEHELLAYATDALLRISGLRLIGTTPNKDGIAVSSGFHCAQPILRR